MLRFSGWNYFLPLIDFGDWTKGEHSAYFVCIWYERIRARGSRLRACPAHTLAIERAEYGRTPRLTPATRTERVSYPLAPLSDQHHAPFNFDSIYPV